MIRLEPRAPALLGVLLLGLGLGCAGGGTPREPRAPSEGIALRFGWEPGLESTVTARRTRTQNIGPDLSSVSTYTFRVDADGERNLRVRALEPRLELEQQLDALPPEARIQLMGETNDVVPDYLLSRRGDFLGIDDLAAYRGRLQQMMKQQLPEGAASSRSLRPYWDLYLSEGFLTARVQEQWSSVVGRWLEADLAVGSDYSFSNRAPVPMIPGQDLLMNWVVAAKKILPCPRAGAQRSCVELEVRSSADPEDTQKMIAAIMETMVGAGENAPVFQSLEVESRLRLVTEPQGLIPHSYELTNQVKGTLRVGALVQPVERVDRTEVVFAYP